MARSKRRMKKIDPAVKTLTFAVGEGGTTYIDISLAASIANRRFYRQGLNWAVSGMTLWSNGASQTISVMKLPDTWVAYNAWMKSFKLWQDMNDQVLDVEPHIQGRYQDFKIFMDADHRDNTAANPFQIDAITAGKTMLPVVRNTGGGSFDLPVLTGMSWDPSEFVFPDPVAGTADNYHAHMVGENSTTAIGDSEGSKSLILGYAYSRARPNVTDPNVPIDVSTKAWMNDVFDYGDQNPEIREDLAEENDTPPYPIAGDESNVEYYPGGFSNLNGLEVIVPSLTITGTTDYSGRMQIPGFNCPCGLICIRNSGAMFIQLHLAPGTHRGYLAVPMQEF
jgi:hypothetical protein